MRNKPVAQMTDDEREYFATPAIEAILRAVPMLQWRRCHECEHVGLYRDNVLPACKCHVCGSADTRAMVQANKILHRVATLPGESQRGAVHA